MLRIRKRAALFMVSLLAISSFAWAYTRDWDESDPIDHSLNSTWPGEIREVMVDVAERLDDIMNGFTSGDTTTDFNVVPFAAQGSDPSAITDQFQFYTKAVSAKTELFMIDEDGNTQQLTSGGEFIGGMQGEIRMWSGAVASIPTGWELADGSCSISCPDLTDKFIMGAGDTYSPDDTGGASTHTHGAGTYIHSHTHALSNVADVTSGSTAQYRINSVNTGDANDTSISGTSASGSSLPPFYALCFIIKT